MGVAARCVLYSKAWVVCALLVMSACTQPAQPLPPDYGSIRGAELKETDFSTADLALSCDAIANERAREATRVEQAEAVIKSDRTGNQIAGYFGALFLLPLVAVETNEAQVALIDESKRRIDTLRTLTLYRRCG